MKPSDDLENQIRVWEKIIDVQMHFNELGVKIRGLAVTVLGAILTAGAFALKEHLSLKIFSATIPAVLPILIIALVTWMAFYLLDHLWYHRLLKGAVLQGDKAEKLLESQAPGIGLTGAISKASALIVRIGKKEINLHSDRRFRLFYGIGAFIVVVLIGLSMTVEVTNFENKLKGSVETRNVGVVQEQGSRPNASSETGKMDKRRK